MLRNALHPNVAKSSTRFGICFSFVFQQLKICFAFLITAILQATNIDAMHVHFFVVFSHSVCVFFFNTFYSINFVNVQESQIQYNNQVAKSSCQNFSHNWQKPIKSMLIKPTWMGRLKLFYTFPINGIHCSNRWP